MSVMTVAGAMERIKSATARSPIAVFRVGPGCMNVNAVFANTVISLQACEGERDSLIGIYHRRMCPETVREEINRAIRQEVRLAG